MSEHVDEEVEEEEKKKVRPKRKKKPKIEIEDTEKTHDGIIVHYRFDTGEAGRMSFGHPFTKESIMDALKRRYRESKAMKTLDLSELKKLKVWEVE